MQAKAPMQAPPIASPGRSNRAAQPLSAAPSVAPMGTARYISPISKAPPPNTSSTRAGKRMRMEVATVVRQPRATTLKITL